MPAGRLNAQLVRKVGEPLGPRRRPTSRARAVEPAANGRPAQAAVRGRHRLGPSPLSAPSPPLADLAGEPRARSRRVRWAGLVPARARPVGRGDGLPAGMVRAHSAPAAHVTAPRLRGARGSVPKASVPKASGLTRSVLKGRALTARGLTDNVRRASGMRGSGLTDRILSDRIPTGRIRPSSVPISSVPISSVPISSVPISSAPVSVRNGGGPRPSAAHPRGRTAFRAAIDSIPAGRMRVGAVAVMVRQTVRTVERPVPRAGIAPGRPAGRLLAVRARLPDPARRHVSPRIVGPGPPVRTVGPATPTAVRPPRGRPFRVPEPGPTAPRGRTTAAGVGSPIVAAATVAVAAVAVTTVAVPTVVPPAHRPSDGRGTTGRPARARPSGARRRAPVVGALLVRRSGSRGSPPGTGARAGGRRVLPVGPIGVRPVPARGTGAAALGMTARRRPRVARIVLRTSRPGPRSPRV